MRLGRSQGLSAEQVGLEALHKERGNHVSCSYVVVTDCVNDMCLV